MSVILSEALSLFKKIESGEIDLRAIPYNDPETDYLISTINEPVFRAWSDCEPDWAACQIDSWALYLKNKRSGTIYFITN